MNKQIDITTPRECIYQQFKGKPGPCPRCGGPLRQSTQTYMIATRRGKKIADSFIVGNDMGWFCTHCPTVVINPEEWEPALLQNFHLLRLNACSTMGVTRRRAMVERGE